MPFLTQPHRAGPAGQHGRRDCCCNPRRWTPASPIDEQLAAIAAGNIQRVEVRKNGVTNWDRIRCMDNRFIQQEQRKVLAAGALVVAVVLGKKKG